MTVQGEVAIVAQGQRGLPGCGPPLPGTAARLRRRVSSSATFCCCASPRPASASWAASLAPTPWMTLGLRAAAQRTS
ncbi:MAG: hypothetical protein MZV65_17335 [Chromatiales bacterium]|nr:hypothetical protein [Chromatiales bacterium]